MPTFSTTGHALQFGNNSPTVTIVGTDTDGHIIYDMSTSGSFYQFAPNTKYFAIQVIFDTAFASVPGVVITPANAITAQATTAIPGLEFYVDQADVTTAYFKISGISSSTPLLGPTVLMWSYQAGSPQAGGGGGSGTVTAISTTAPLSGGTITTSGTIGISQATTSTNGYLSSTDWNTFNSKQVAGSYALQSTIISTTAPLSGGGSLAANRTLSIPRATSSVDGYLSQTDWTTFNSKFSFTTTNGIDGYGIIDGTDGLTQNIITGYGGKGAINDIGNAGNGAHLNFTSGAGGSLQSGTGLAGYGGDIISSAGIGGDGYADLGVLGAKGGDVKNLSGWGGAVGGYGGNLFNYPGTGGNALQAVQGGHGGNLYNIAGAGGDGVATAAPGNGGSLYNNAGNAGTSGGFGNAAGGNAYINAGTGTQSSLDGSIYIGTTAAKFINIGNNNVGSSTIVYGPFKIGSIGINPAGATTNQILQYNGTDFIPATVSAGNLSGTLTAGNIPYATGSGTLSPTLETSYGNRLVWNNTAGLGWLGVGCTGGGPFYPLDVAIDGNTADVIARFQNTNNAVNAQIIIDGGQSSTIGFYNGGAETWSAGMLKQSFGVYHYAITETGTPTRRLSIFPGGNLSLGASTTDGGALLQLNASASSAGISFGAGSSLAVSASSTGRIRYNSGTQHLEASENAGSYSSVALIGNAQTFTKSQNVASFALTDAASIATDATQSNVFTVTLTATGRTLANPSGLVSGGTYLWVIRQDSGGSKTITAYGSLFKFPGAALPILTTTGSAVDMISAVYDGTQLNCVFQADFR